MGLLSKLRDLFTLVPDPLDSLQYNVPKDWSTENLHGGVLLLAPEIEENWQTNIFIEARKDPKQRTTSDALVDLISNLEREKPGFRLLKQDQILGNRGLQIERVAYSTTSDDGDLMQLEFIAQGPSDHKFFFLAAVAAEYWPKYKMMFDIFGSSIAVQESR